MPNDDIIITGLNESIATFFENPRTLNEDLASRNAQRAVDALNGDYTGVRGFVQRNGIGVRAGADYLANSMIGRFTNPQFLMNTLPQMGLNVINGAQRAAEERAQKQREQQELTKLQNSAKQAETQAENEEKKVQQEADSLKKAQEAQAKLTEAFDMRAIGRGIGNRVGGFYDWSFGTDSGDAQSIVGPGVTGSNVRTATINNPIAGKPSSINVAFDTRSVAQRRTDALAGMAKSYGDQYVQGMIDQGLHKATDAAGYYAAKLKYAIDDAKARKAKAKAEAQQLKAEKQALKKEQVN